MYFVTTKDERNAADGRFSTACEALTPFRDQISNFSSLSPWPIPIFLNCNIASLTPQFSRFRVLRRSAHYTLVECDLLTGRKHQIRRHARLAGHAVVGDERYGTSPSPQL